MHLCRGRNSAGQLGYAINTENIGDTTASMENFGPVVLSSSTTVSVDAVAVGGKSTCVILSDSKSSTDTYTSEAGNVKCWGDNTYGQLGIGQEASSLPGVGKSANEMGDNLASVNLGTGRTAAKIAVGTYHVCALLDNSDVKCWGLNDKGQLGQGDTTDIGGGGSGSDPVSTLQPVDLGLAASETVTDIKCGSRHSCVLLSSGAVKCWGHNDKGQLGAEDSNYNIGVSPSDMGSNLVAATSLMNSGNGLSAAELACSSKQKSYIIAKRAL